MSLFSRLVLGYLVIFVLVMAVSVYAILQLRRFNEVTRSILETDNRILEYEKKLTDALWEQIRYERKFIITQDDVLYDQFLLFKSDFEQYVEEAFLVSDPQAGKLLKDLITQYQRYLNLVLQEVRWLKLGRGYPQRQFREAKEKEVNEVLGLLEQMRAHSQQNTYGKIKTLAEAGAQARRVAVWMTGAAVLFIIVVSLLITRSVTRPVSAFKRKTREIAKGNFESIVNVSSPPEMAELAGAFNFMSQKLKELDRMKSDFFSSMSHELRTPLASIREGTSLLLDGIGGSLTDKQKKLLTILGEESERLISLVNSLLDLSKMEAGMMVYNFTAVQLAPFINKVMIEMGPLVEAKKIRLDTKLDDGLPMIEVDSERFLQALRNLVGNAVKFTPEGGRIKISASRSDRSVEVSVADTGPGIPAEHLATIFEKYQQADATGSYRIKGTGLGLALVKHIVTSHGGRIWAESEPGQGSRFIFVLPA